MIAIHARNPGYNGKSSPCPLPVGLVLVASKAAVNIFGLAVRYTARAWLPQVERSAEEVARELVCRAVETTGIPGPHPRWTALYDKDIPLIEVRLRLEYPSLVVEVWDGDKTSPYPPPGTHLDDHLATVHERAQCWNWFPRGHGKVIWAELGEPPQHHTDPRAAGRFCYPAPHGPSEPLRDVEAMRRVRDEGPMVPASWPYSADIYGAFAALKGAGFTAYCCGDRRMPHVLVAVYVWEEEGYVDVVNMRGADRVTAARLPKSDGDLDIFAPQEVVWHYMGAVVPAVAAMLRLPRPGHPDAPTATHQAPLTLFVSSHEQRPMSVTSGKRP